jgi:hypothetical protein
VWTCQNPWSLARGIEIWGFEALAYSIYIEIWGADARWFLGG